MTQTNGSKWAVVATVLLTVLAFSVQWGVVNTKLGHLEKRLDEMILEARGLRSEYRNIERRLSYLEGSRGDDQQP